MLKSLHISNYALIDRLDINFESGFSVITGETGAGKSIILGALSLVTGQRADSKSIKQGEEKCIVETVFDIKNYRLEEFFEENELDYDEDNCTIRRELTSSGKSRAFINDTPVSLGLLRQLSESLIDIHSQHENLLLGKDDYQRNVVDLLARNEDVLLAYKKDYSAWKKLSSELTKLIEIAEKSKADYDYIQFQYQQLSDMDLKEGEQEDLEQELETLTHAEEIKTELGRIHQLTNEENTALPLIKEVSLAVSKIKQYLPDGESIYERIQTIYIDLKDIADEAYSLGERVEFNPSRLEWIENRLNEVYGLFKKHKLSSVEELMTLRSTYAERLQQIDSFDEEIAALKKQLAKAYELLQASANKLSESRKKVCAPIKQQLEDLLSKLGMPNVQFETSVLPSTDFTSDGKDEIQFLFSANKNRKPEAISQIASGGEISRLMLSIKSLIAGKTKLPTIIFDEIDTGVSGDIADRMGKIMKDMASGGMQVISITHLPQIAAKGKRHYKVFKKESGDQVQTQIESIENDDRVREIAQMLSGSHITEAAIQNAVELLK